MGTQPLTAIAYYRSRPGLERPDMENILMPTSLNAHVWFPGVRQPHEDVLTSLNCVLRPGSRGTVRLRSADPSAPPEIRFNLLSDPQDVDLLRHSIEWTRDLMVTDPIRDFVGDEAFPGPKVADRQAMDSTSAPSPSRPSIRPAPAGWARMRRAWSMPPCRYMASKRCALRTPPSCRP